MLFRQLTDEERVEQPSLQGSRAHNELVDHGPKSAAEPLADRYREPHLSPPEDLRRHEIPKSLPQHDLRLPAANLVVGGQSYDVLDQLAIKIWHAALDRCGHAHLILLHQQLDQ